MPAGTLCSPVKGRSTSKSLTFIVGLFVHLFDFNGNYVRVWCVQLQELCSWFLGGSFCKFIYSSDFSSSLFLDINILKQASVHEVCSVYLKNNLLAVAILGRF